MHIENLGEKTYLMTFDATKAEPQEDGSHQLTFLNGATETRLNIPSQLFGSMPDHPCMVTVTGNAKLKVWVNSDCMISGVEEMDVEELSLSECAMRTEGFAEVLPF